MRPARTAGSSMRTSVPQASYELACALLRGVLLEEGVQAGADAVERTG
jgi:hypothetical protein